MTSSTEIVLEKIKNNIRNGRKILKFTQLQLGIKSGLSKDYIYDLEAGRRTPSIDALCKIADALKVEVYELLK